MSLQIWLAIHAAAWVYGLPPATLERVSWHESRHHAGAVRGSHCGLGQVSTRWSRYTCAQLQVPLVGALESARLLAWSRKHCHDDGLTYYRHGRCK